MTQDLVALVQLLVEKNYLAPDILEMSEEDFENYDTIEEKLRGELITDVQSAWAEVQYGDKIITVLDKETGIESVVRDALVHMDDEDIASLLGRVSNNFEEVMRDWNWKLDEVDDYYINESKQLRSSRETIRASAVKKTAGGKGIGDYRRGDVLTQVNSVQPGQLLVLDSITYKATNLVKVTQVFDDKFYAIFVNPVSPAEKRQTSDEEFVVHGQDLERGEYYIALEPSPKSVNEEVVDETVVDTPVDDPVDDVPAPAPDAEAVEAPIEDKPPVAASIEKTAIESPVRDHEDYGDLPDSAQERVDEALASKKTATGEEPASATDTPANNPVTVDDTGDHEMKNIEIGASDEDEPTTFARFQNPTTAAEFEDGDGPEVAMADEGEVVDAEGVKDEMDYDHFEIDSEPNTAGDYAGITGSQSFAGALLAELETEANGGLGDDGSAYDLSEGGGRNFTGVNEADVEVVASQYIEGKAVSFASLEDFMGFIGDAYGVKQSSAEFRDAWHADDIQALSSLIVKHATKNDLQ